jgi:hypothetical protein
VYRLQVCIDRIQGCIGSPNQKLQVYTEAWIQGTKRHADYPTAFTQYDPDGATSRSLVRLAVDVLAIKLLLHLTNPCMHPNEIFRYRYYTKLKGPSPTHDQRRIYKDVYDVETSRHYFISDNSNEGGRGGQTAGLSPKDISVSKTRVIPKSHIMGLVFHCCIIW